MRSEVEKLLKIYKKHKTIIVGVDFDDTIFPYNKNDATIYRCTQVKDMLKALRKYITLCLYTVADEQGLKYKKEIMVLYGLTPDYINDSPIELFKGCRKPYFNILLDDKAGLSEALDILHEFKNNLIT